MNTGKLLDIYFQFAAGGDFYLCQVLCLEYPNSVDFDTPCPCWHDPKNSVVKEALGFIFCHILMKQFMVAHEVRTLVTKYWEWCGLLLISCGNWLWLDMKTQQCKTQQ